MKQHRADYPAKHHYWGPVARNYNDLRVGSPLRRVIWKREFRLLEKIAREQVKANATILDAPTGTGRCLPLLRNLGHKTTGIDISLDMLNIPKKVAETSRPSLVQGDCEALPFSDHSFDYVVSLRFLGHVPPELRIRVLREFKRVASKGIIVAFPVLNRFTGLKFELGNFRYQLKNGRSRPWWPATPESLSQEMERAGLKIDYQERLWGPFSQIAFLCLVPSDPCPLPVTNTDRQFHLASA